MIKMKYALLDEPLVINGGTILVVEDTRAFSRLVEGVYRYGEDEGVHLFTDKLVAIKPQELLVITDILGFDVNTAPILKLVYADLEDQLNHKPEVKMEIENLANQIASLLGRECLENELDLEYDVITVMELIKALEVRIETMSDTVFDKCLELIQVYRFLSKKKLLVLVNASSYLLQEEINSLLEYISLHQLRVLFLEPRQVCDIPQYILDKDYVLMGSGLDR